VLQRQAAGAIRLRRTLSLTRFHQGVEHPPGLGVLQSSAQVGLVFQNSGSGRFEIRRAAPTAGPGAEREAAQWLQMDLGRIYMEKNAAAFLGKWLRPLQAQRVSALEIGLCSSSASPLER